MGDGSGNDASRYGNAFEITNENAGPPLAELKRVNEFDNIVGEAIGEIKEKLREKSQELHKLFSRQES